jgi:hypothetical protein
MYRAMNKYSCLILISAMLGLLGIQIMCYLAGVAQQVAMLDFDVILQGSTKSDKV